MEIGMKFIFAVVFCSATCALLMTSPALGVEEYSCLEQDTITGVMLDPVTIDTPEFSCHGYEHVFERTPGMPFPRLPPLIHVQFKDAGTRAKIGDTLTLRGTLYRVSDPGRQLVGWQLKDAEIVTDVPIADIGPSPSTEAALHRYIDSLESGMPNYAEMQPPMGLIVNAGMPWILDYIQHVGALTSLRFLFADQNGFDIYLAKFEHGSADWLIAPLSTSGKVRMQGFLPLPASLNCISDITMDSKSPDELQHYTSKGPPYMLWQCRQWPKQQTPDF